MSERIIEETGQIQQFLIHPATKEKLCLQESSEAKEIKTAG